MGRVQGGQWAAPDPGLALLPPDAPVGGAASRAEVGLSTVSGAGEGRVGSGVWCRLGSGGAEVRVAPEAGQGGPLLCTRNEVRAVVEGAAGAWARAIDHGTAATRFLL